VFWTSGAVRRVEWADSPPLMSCCIEVVSSTLLLLLNPLAPGPCCPCSIMEPGEATPLLDLRRDATGDVWWSKGASAVLLEVLSARLASLAAAFSSSEVEREADCSVTHQHINTSTRRVGAVKGNGGRVGQVGGWTHGD
jgi:hypothetical protein